MRMPAALSVMQSRHTKHSLLRRPRAAVSFGLLYLLHQSSGLSFETGRIIKMSLSQNSRADSLYYRVISLLATIYREKADQRFSEMYLLAINECKEHGFEYEYYVQLRKADLCYTEELSIPMLNEAVKYFKAHNYQKEYGKAVHNLGTDHLYLGNSAEAQETLEASKIYLQRLEALMKYTE